MSEKNDKKTQSLKQSSEASSLAGISETFKGVLEILPIEALKDSAVEALHRTLEAGLITAAKMFLLVFVTNFKAEFKHRGGFLAGPILNNIQPYLDLVNEIKDPWRISNAPDSSTVQPDGK